MERFSVCLIQPPNYVHSLALLEVAQLLAGSLESLGAGCRLLANQVEPQSVNIVLGYHLLGPGSLEQLAKERVILYQLEQLSDRENSCIFSTSLIFARGRIVYLPSWSNSTMYRSVSRAHSSTESPPFASKVSTAHVDRLVAA